jgi:hypothetical protein
VSVHRDIDSDSGNDESFVSRWSRRKQEAGPDIEHANQASDPLEQKPTATAPPALTDADMPDPDTLQADSDFAAFMSPGVSEQLRAMALRRLFHLPGLHTPDGLDDYDDDFTQLASLGDTLTHDMRRMLARETSVDEQPSPGASREAAPEPMPIDTERAAADERSQQAADQEPELDDEPQRPV